jgi:predicted TIM-barrel fold metal-dependent hydrolase
MALDFSELHQVPIIDCHVHHGDSSLVPDIVALMDSVGIKAINVVSTPHPDHINLNPQGLEFKARYPQRVYLFGSLDYAELMAEGHLTSNLADQIDVLQNVGCDGIKMVEGKPLARKLLPLPPFDGPEYRDFFAHMERRRFPLLFHVGDPEEFWDADSVPPSARARGWFYGDDPVFPSKEDLYTEVSRVLQRHPHLQVIFAHFYFLSADLPRAAALLDAYPNVHLDICPGVEMYTNFSRQPEATREFFLAYQDRIVYGTDTGTSTLEKGPALDRQREIGKHWTMRMFLESERPFEAPHTFRQRPETLRGIGLPSDSLRKICRENFRRLVGDAPAQLNRQAACDECHRLAALTEGMGRDANEIRRISQVIEDSGPSRS